MKYAWLIVAFLVLAATSVAIGQVGMLSFQGAGSELRTDGLRYDLPNQSLLGTNAEFTGTMSVTGASEFSGSLESGGILRTTGSPVIDNRTNTAITADANTTYTAAQVLTGWITRTGMTVNRTDAFPTAANLVAGVSGATAGDSFWFVVDNNDGAQSVIPNGASAGITYAGDTSAIQTDWAVAMLVVLTNVTSGAEAATVIIMAH